MVKRVPTWTLFLAAGVLAACAGLHPTANATPVPTLDPRRYHNDEGGFWPTLPESWRVAGPLAAQADGVPYSLTLLGIEPEAGGGLEARGTQVGGGGVPFAVEWVLVERSGKLIGVSIHDPETLAPLENVLQSVTFD
jgi:hypothetical protein